MTYLKRASIEVLTKALALPATGDEQDWEVELADPNRIGDFLAAYQHPSLTADDKVALMALLLASVDRSMESGLGVPGEWEQIAEALGLERNLHCETIRYWEREGDDDPVGWFHVTPLIRALRTVA